MVEFRRVKIRNTYASHARVSAASCRIRARNGTASSRWGPVDRIRSIVTRCNSTEEKRGKKKKNATISLSYLLPFTTNIPETEYIYFCSDLPESRRIRGLHNHRHPWKSIFRGRDIKFHPAFHRPTPPPVFILRHVFISQRVHTRGSWARACVCVIQPCPRGIFIWRE